MKNGGGQGDGGSAEAQGEPNAKNDGPDQSAGAGKQAGDQSGGQGGRDDRGQPGKGGEKGGTGDAQDGGQPPRAGDGNAGGGSRSGDGAWGGGDGSARNDRDALAGDQEKREIDWGNEDLRHARNAADLAVEHLRDSVEAGRSDMLEQLGWTPEQARAFVERWQAMRRMADSDDPRQRGEFERAVRSLGLRPAGVRSSRDAPADVKGGQAEGRRSRPPSEYRDQVRAYLQGTSGE